MNKLIFVSLIVHALAVAKRVTLKGTEAMFSPKLGDAIELALGDALMIRRHAACHHA